MGLSPRSIEACQLCSHTLMVEMKVNILRRNSWLPSSPAGLSPWAAGSDCPGAYLFSEQLSKQSFTGFHGRLRTLGSQTPRDHKQFFHHLSTSPVGPRARAGPSPVSYMCEGRQALLTSVHPANDPKAAMEVLLKNTPFWEFQAVQWLGP